MHKNFTFPRQTTRFTCGPACLAAVSMLFGKPIKEDNIAQEVAAEDFLGTKTGAMDEWSCANLPYKSAGEGTYSNGLAIANIRRKESGTGHYVLILGKKNDVIRYYCPLIGETVDAPEKDIMWINSNGSLKKWSINFETDIDFYDLKISPEKHVFFLGNPLDELNIDTDTSLIIKSGYERLNIKTSWHSYTDIFIRGSVLYLSGRPVYPKDIVWLRQNPSCDTIYYTTLQQLCHVQGFMLNKPEAILINNDKKLTNFYREDNNIYTIYSERALLTALQHMNLRGVEKYVIKPPNLFGGKDVLISDDKDEIIKQMNKIIDYSGCAVVERYIPPRKNTPTDVSVIITWDRVISAISRKATCSSGLTPYHCGSIASEIKGLKSSELKIIEQVQEVMRERGIFWAGLNFIEEEIIEINLSCPGGLQSMNEVYSSNLEMELIDSATKYQKNS